MFLYSYWQSLSLPTRHKIAIAFNIPKKGPTHVDSNRIVSDGYNIKDVERALNIAALQEFTKWHMSDETRLWELMVAKIEGKDIDEPITITEPVVIEPVVETTPPAIQESLAEPQIIKKKGRPKKIK